MENKKKAKVDYAAIIREFEMYGRGRSLKQFCDDSSYVYPNVLRYIIRLDDEKFFLPVFDERFASIQVNCWRSMATKWFTSIQIYSFSC